MIEEINNSQKNNSTAGQKNLLDFFILLVKWRKIILLNVTIVTICAAIISFLLPKWYTSTANILPPKSSSGLFSSFANFSSSLKDLSKTLGRLGTVSEEAYNFLAILQSRTTYENVIKKFNLREVYNFDSDDPIEEVIDELDSNVKFNVEDEGNITIKVTDKNPQRAADMANYFVELLNDISIKLGMSEAKSNREFIEKRYLQAINDIKLLEDSLKEFSKKYSVYALEEQTKAAISVAAELNAQIEMQEIEYELLSKEYGLNHPIVQGRRLFINEMKKRLDNMKFGNKINYDDVKLYSPFSQLPEVGIKYLRLMREYELQTKLLEFIVPVYEQAKIEEKKDVPVCVILDKAVPAQKKTYPKRVLIIIVSFFASLFFSIGYVLIRESFEKFQKDNVTYKKLIEGILLPLNIKIKKSTD